MEEAVLDQLQVLTVTPMVTVQHQMFRGQFTGYNSQMMFLCNLLDSFNTKTIETLIAYSPCIKIL